MAQSVAHGAEAPGRFMSVWAVTQDVVTFGAGLGILGHEVLIATTERKTLIFVAIVLMGGQAFRRGIEALRLIKGVPGD